VARQGALMASKRSKPAQGQPHDGLIRSALESLDNARSAIAAVLPADLLARLDLGRLRPAPARIVDDLRTLSQDPGFRDYLTRLLSYTFETANGDMDAVHALLRANLDPSMEIQMGTLAEQLIQRGMLKGRAEGIREGLVKGIQEGLQEGVLNGQREVLARQLALKFGVLPIATQERIARASRDELVECSLRVLTAETLDAVFD